MKLALFLLNDRNVLYAVHRFLDFLEKDESIYCEVHIYVKERRVITGGKKRNSAKTKNKDGLVVRVLNSVRARYLTKKEIKTISEIKIRAASVTEIDSANSDHTIRKLKENSITHGIFVLYDEIVKKETIDYFDDVYNVHPAHLPDFRGCQPIYWLTEHKQDVSAITLHRMVVGIDEGAIIYESPYLLSKYPYQSSRNMLRNLPLCLFFALRRILLFPSFPGIDQNSSLGVKRYYGRPEC